MQHITINEYHIMSYRASKPENYIIGIIVRCFGEAKAGINGILRSEGSGWRGIISCIMLIGQHQRGCIIRATNEMNGF